MAKLIRFPAELAEWLADLAAAERRSFTAQVIRIIEEWRAWREGGRGGRPPAA